MTGGARTRFLKQKTKPILGVFSRPVQTYFQNMAHCGRDVVPAFGLEGEYITAWAAASWLQKRAGRAWL